MKLLFAVVGLLVAFISHAVIADKALAEKLKPYEEFSPYKWTQWIQSRPGRPIAAAAVAYAPQPQPEFHARPTTFTEDEEDEDEDDEYDSVDGVNAFENWFKRAILPQPPPTPLKKTKEDKKPKLPTTKKPSILELPLDFWGPPPSIAPNVTLPPPPGYWAAKKTMFISKLFAALAATVLNATGPTDAEATTASPTTISPRQVILDELSEVLLSDFTRSVPPPPPSSEDTTAEPEEFYDSDEDSEEEATTLAPRKTKPATSTINPFLLNQIDFLAKLTEAIASQSKPTPASTPKPKQVKSSIPSAPVDTKVGKKSAKKSSKKIAKTPKYLKFIPTTPSPSLAPEVPEIDYNALAKALLGK